MRASFLRLAHPGGTPDLPSIETVGGCKGRWFGTGSRPIIWLHGGGYVFGGSDSHAAPALALSKVSGRPVFIPDYPLAPEQPWPAQRDAVTSVLHAIPECDVVGDSAGGHLALVLAAMHPGKIRRLAVLSPNTDRSGLSTTRKLNSATDLMNDDAQDRRLSDMALGALPSTDPEASPLLGNLSKLPPVLMTATTTEVLMDDTLLFASRAARAGVPLTLQVLPNLFHMWHLWPDALPQAHQTLKAVADHLT